MKRILLLSLISLFISNPLFSFGQNISIPGQIPELEEQISMIVEPELPKPNEKITIKLEAYGTDLTRAFITWKINNVIKKSGRGEQSFELNSGIVGTAQQVVIDIQPINGPLITKQLFFKPQEVDLLWESRSYTPPFYKGKALPGYMGTSVVVAIPNFDNGRNSNNFTYKWKKNYEIQNNESGFMKNSLDIKGGILLQPEEIQIEVTDDTGGKAKSSIDYDYIEPVASFYEKNPLYGTLFNRKITSRTIKNKEIGLIVVPYFFDTLNKNVLTYKWSINDRESFLFTKDAATFRYDGGDSGTSVIDISVKNQSNFLQETKARASLYVDKVTSKIEF